MTGQVFAAQTNQGTVLWLAAFVIFYRQSQNRPKWLAYLFQVLRFERPPKMKAVDAEIILGGVYKVD